MQPVAKCWSPGLLRANALVISYANTGSALKILALVQELRPGLALVVRTLDDSDIDRLKEAGAAEVVAEILEGSLMLATQALMLLGVPLNRVQGAYARRASNVMGCSAASTAASPTKSALTATKCSRGCARWCCRRDRRRWERL